MKCIWEQFDNSETEVNPEVYGRLAEDVTYKLWELCNVRPCVAVERKSINQSIFSLNYVRRI